MTDHRWPTYPPRHISLDAAVLEEAEAGRGAFKVRDSQGRVYLDAINGIGCLPLGHGNPRWIAAMEAQMRRLVASAGTFFTAPQQMLAGELSRRVPVRDARVFFGNSGTEVTEAAIKLALRATGRDMILAFERAFHGRTLGAVALTANPAYRERYVSTLDETDAWFARMNVAHVPFGDLDATQGALERYKDRVAMIVVEPIQGEGGIHCGTPAFLQGLRVLSRRFGALLGIDEIQSGSGRTGNFSAWQTLVGSDPEFDVDIAWFAKALGGGYPLAACTARADLASAMTRGTHGSTFGGNPLACAAGQATLQIFDEDDALASAAAQLPALRKIAAKRPLAAVREIRGAGAMIGIELADATVAGGIVRAMHDEGVLLTQSGKTAIRLLLPYHAGAQQLQEVWDGLGRALAKVSLSSSS